MGVRKIFVASVVFFTGILFVIPPGLIDPNFGNTILTITTFLFGIFAGFCILVTTTDYTTVRSLASEETSHWISLYQTMRVYRDSFAEELRAIIEHYIIRSFDYDFLDYARETKEEFKTATEFLIRLPVDEKESSVHQNILDRLADITLARQNLTALGKRSLSSLEWIVLLVLAVTVVASLYTLRNGTLFFDFITVAVSASIVLVLVLIREIDKYTWNEGTFSFDVFNNVLTAMDGLPYYPAEFVGKIIWPRESEYRVGTLISPGKSWERKIEIVSKS